MTKPNVGPQSHPQANPSSSETSRVTPAEWKQIVAKYQQPSLWRANWQIVSTFVPYVALWAIMYWSVSYSWWLTVPLAALAGAILVRVFIIFHDCGHGSYFASKKANDVVGFITGLFTFTPFCHWRWQHSLHHASAGDLDRRGVGDIWTMTVQEYLESSRWKRFAYRLARNPIVLFVIAPIYLFMFEQRIPSIKANRRERNSVWWMNAAIAVKVVVMSLIFGFKVYLILQLMVMAIAGAAGIWLFYVQHQFEDVYWERREDWDFTAAALQGSSFYKLPKILHWFSGNIGYHHIHHLSSRIPNYHLALCHRSHSLFQDVKPITLLGSLKCLNLRLWDEQRGKLVGYRRIKEIRREMKLQNLAEAVTGREPEASS